MYGHEAVVELLMKRDNVDVNSKDKYKRTSLSWAAIMGYEVVVKSLMKQDEVDVNSKDEHKRTPLSWAAEKGHEAMIKFFDETERRRCQLER